MNNTPNTALIATFCLLLAGSAQAQAGKVPAVTNAAFAAAHPEAQNVTWDVEKDGYEASFMVGKQEMSVEYDKAGKLVATETEIAVSALPEGVRSYVAANHKGKQIKEAAEIVAADGTKTYEAEVGGNDLLFDAQGNYQK